MGKCFRELVCLVAVVCFLTAGMMVIAQVQTKPSTEATIDSDIVESVKGGDIDWENGYIYAKGIGAVAPASQIANRAVAKLKAKDYAKADAIASMLMAIEGTTISYDGLGKDYMADVTLKQTIKGYLKNVEIVSIKDVKEKDAAFVIVTVKKAMYGDQGPGTAFLEKIAADQAADPSLKTKNPRLIEIPVEKLPSERAKYLSSDAGWSHFSKYVARVKENEILKAKGAPASARPADTNENYEPAPQKGPFTGLIIDTRGYDVKRAMSPKIRKQNGEVIWGNLPVDPDVVVDRGVASYVKSLEDARNNERAGKNPLLLIAVGRAGGAAMCDTIISDTDGDFAVTNNTNDKFFDDFNVIFVTDPSKAKLIPASK